MSESRRDEKRRQIVEILLSLGFRGDNAGINVYVGYVNGYDVVCHVSEGLYAQEGCRHVAQ